MFWKSKSPDQLLQKSYWGYEKTDMQKQPWTDKWNIWSKRIIKQLGEEQSF